MATQKKKLTKEEQERLERIKQYFMNKHAFQSKEDYNEYLNK